MGGFACPRCRLAFSSWPLLRTHEEKLCLGTPVPSITQLPGEEHPPVERGLDTAGRPRDASVGVSQHGDPAESHHLLVLPGLRPTVRPQRGPGRAPEGPLGAVLTPQERALLRAADPAPRRLTAEEETGRPLAPPRGPEQQPQELLEAHQRHVAEIRARTQELEQQREGLCQRLAALGSRAAVNNHPEEEELELSRDLEELQGQVRQIGHGGAALHLDNVLPVSGPLAAEARALRLSYLRAGGHDPDILDQLLQLQIEAMELENGPTRLRRGKRMDKHRSHPPAEPLAPWMATETLLAVPAEPPGTGTQGLDAALLAVELENRWLEDEVLALKVRRKRRADAGSRAAQWHAEELAQLQAEVGMLRRHTEWMGPWLPPAILPPLVGPQLPPALGTPQLFTESTGPAPGSSSPAAPSRPPLPSTLPLPPFAALEDPPPTREPRL